MSLPLNFPSLTRRQFLRRMGIASGAVAGMSVLHDLRAIDAGAGPVKVVIIGAGLAGLVAAYELEKRGHTVVILEAEKQHVGGRARTIRFEDGSYGEAGAMRIPLRHDLTRHYVSELGLTLRKFVQSNPEAYVYARGRRERAKDVKKLASLYRLKPAEQGKSPDDFWSDAVTACVKKLSDAEKADLSAPTPTTKAIRDLDQLSLEQLFEGAGLSQEAIEFMAIGEGMESEMFFNADESVREEAKDVWTLDFHEIVGGTDRLPSAFGDKLRAKIRMGCPVISLEQNVLAGKASAVYLDEGVERREEGDFVLCTLPLPVLQRLRVEPAFSPEKNRAIRQMSYDSSTKVLAVANSRFWELEDGIFGGGTFTDLPSGATYYPSNNAEARDAKISAGPGVMLASYTWGMAARRLAALPHEQRADLVLRHLANVHPQLAKPDMIRKTASWSWDNHPWSGGAFAWFMPGQHAGLYASIIAPEGRIHFAGEHASLTHTWMQGALESGLRAVQEIVVRGRGR